MKTITLFVFAVLVSLCSVSIAQWQPDVRLTNDTSSSETSASNAWCVASSGDYVHVIWSDKRNVNKEIYYKRSTNGGLSWGADTRLTSYTGDSEFPSVSVSGLFVYVVWEDDRDLNPEIYFKRSTDGGMSWGPDIRITNHVGDSMSPSLSVSGSVVHVVWFDDREGNSEIYYKRSTDGGISWGPDMRLTINTFYSQNSSVSVSGMFVHIVWWDSRDLNNEIYYKRSSDGGLSWGQDTRLTNDTGTSMSPSVTVSGSVVHAVWSDNRDGNNEIYYKHSTNDGISWGTDYRLTDDPGVSTQSCVSVSGMFVHVVWWDTRDEKIYYKRSTDGGITWSADIGLTATNGSPLTPSIALSGQVVHVVWQDARDANTEIYYKRNPTGNPVGINNINTEIPASSSLKQNYPNPFNPATKIRFDVPKTDIISIKIFDVLGRVVAILVNEQLQPGIYEVDFDGSNYSTGIYYYTITAGLFSQTRKMVLIR